MSRPVYTIKRPTAVGLLSRGKDYSVRDLGSSLQGYTNLLSKELGVSLNADGPQTRWTQIHELSHVKNSLWSPERIRERVERTTGRRLKVGSILAAEDSRINEKAIRAVPDAHEGFALSAPGGLRMDLEGYAASHASPAVLADTIRPACDASHVAAVDAFLARLPGMPDRELTVLRVTVPLAILLDDLRAGRKPAPEPKPEPKDEPKPDESTNLEPEDESVSPEDEPEGEPAEDEDEPAEGDEDGPAEDEGDSDDEGDEGEPGDDDEGEDEGAGSDEGDDEDDEDEDGSDGGSDTDEDEGEPEDAEGDSDDSDEGASDSDDDSDDDGPAGDDSDGSDDEGASEDSEAFGEPDAHDTEVPCGKPLSPESDDRPYPWLIPTVHEPALTVPQAGGNFTVTTAETGSVLRWGQLHRIATDGVVFRRNRRKPGALQRGTVLIDASGSMNLEDAHIEALVAMLPHGTVAIYSSDGSATAAIVVVARGGKRVASIADRTLVPRFGGNGCDGPALLWLSRQPGPRLWICDGHVTGDGDCAAAWQHDECGAIMTAAGIVQVSAETHETLKATRTMEYSGAAEINVQALPAVLRELERGRL